MNAVFNEKIDIYFKNQKDEDPFEEYEEFSEGISYDEDLESWKYSIGQISEQWKKADVSMMSALLPIIHGLVFYNNPFVKIIQKSDIILV